VDDEGHTPAMHFMQVDSMKTGEQAQSYFFLPVPKSVSGNCCYLIAVEPSLKRAIVSVWQLFVTQRTQLGGHPAMIKL